MDITSFATSASLSDLQNSILSTENWAFRILKPTSRIPTIHSSEHVFLDFKHSKSHHLQHRLGLLQPQSFGPYWPSVGLQKATSFWDLQPQMVQVEPHNLLSLFIFFLHTYVNRIDASHLSIYIVLRPQEASASQGPGRPQASSSR